MPFVNIRIYEGHGKDKKDEIAKRVTGAIMRRHQAARRRRCGSSSRTSTRPTGTSAGKPGERMTK